MKQKEKMLKRKTKTSVHFESPYMNKRVYTKPEYASQSDNLFPRIILEKAIEGDVM